MLKLAQYLQNEGCDVNVLCAKTAHVDDYGYADLLATLNVTYVEDPVAMAGSKLYKQPQNDEVSAASSVAGDMKSRFKRLVIELLTPDTAVMMTRRLTGEARKFLATVPNLTVITSGPPHSVHLVGHMLKRSNPAIQWIVDYRDSWNGTSLFRKRSRFLQKVNEFLEKKVLSACDRFTYISIPMLKKAELLGGPRLAGKSSLIANGFDASLLELFTGRAPRAGNLRVGYFGAIDDGANSYRNPACLLEVLSSRPELAVTLELYGSIQISPAWKERLGNRLHIGPRLSHGEALRVMAEMDVLLLLHTREEGADEVITGKVFEYIASGLPIVSVGPKGMAVNTLLVDDAATFQAEHTSADEIEAVLVELADRKRRQDMPVRDRHKLGSFSRESQFSGFLNLVKVHAMNC